MTQAQARNWTMEHEHMMTSLDSSFEVIQAIAMIVSGEAEDVTEAAVEKEWAAPRFTQEIDEAIAELLLNKEPETIYWGLSRAEWDGSGLGPWVG